MYDKEKIYDEKISPLMTEIIRICKENDIQMLTSFGLKESDENGENMACSTYIPSKEYTIERILEARHCIYKKPSFIAMTITNR